MSLKTEMEQFKTSINSVITHYTKEILSYFEKDINTQIARYIENYTIGTSPMLTIKINISNINIMKIINDINDINICKTSKYFDFCSFTYHTNKQVFLLKEGLEQYISEFKPYWNHDIKEHYIVVGKYNFYYLKVLVPISFTCVDNIMEKTHDDYMNQVHYDYYMNQLDEIIRYVIDEINSSIKRNIVLKKDNIINIMDYLCDPYTMEYIRLIDNMRREVDIIKITQKNLINICKILKVPLKIRISDDFEYFNKIRMFINYIYFKVEKHYIEQNIKITRLAEKIVEASKYGNHLSYASHRIEL